MEASNDRISLRQMKRLIVLDIFSIAILIIPRIVVSQTGYDGILAILFGMLFTVIYIIIFIYFIGKFEGNFIVACKNNLGSFVTILFCLLYLFKFMLSATFIIQLFSQVIKQTLLPDTNRLLLVIPLVLTAGYVTYKGCEARARMAEIFYFIILVPIFVMLVFGLQEVDYANLTPVLTVSILDSLKGGYGVFLALNAIELILFLSPFIRREPNRKKTKSIQSYSIQSLLIASVFILLFFVITVGIVGSKATQSSLFSTISIMQIIEFPGSLLNRQDSIVLGLWLVSAITLISGFVFYIHMIGRQLYQKKNHCLLPFILVILILLGLIPMDLEQYFIYYSRYMMWIGFPQSIILPFILLIAMKIRRKPSAKIKKTMMFIVGTLVMVTTMSGCGDQAEIEDRDFVQAVGIDLSGDLMTVQFVMPDLSSYSKDGGSAKQELVRKFEGYAYREIEEDYKLQSDKRLDYSHLKVIILGESFSKSKEQMTSFLNFIESNNQISKKTLVVVGLYNAAQIVSLNEQVDGGIGDHIVRMYENSLTGNEKAQVTVGDLINASNNQDECVMIPVLSRRSKQARLHGMALLYQNQMKYEITAEDMVFADILTGYGEGKRLFLYEDGEKIANYIVKLTDVKNTIDIIRNGNKPYAFIQVEGEAVVEKGIEEFAEMGNAQKVNAYDAVETLLNERLKAMLMEQLDLMYRQQKLDYLNLYRMDHYKSRVLSRIYNGRQNLFLKDLTYRVDVKLRVNQ